MDAREGGGSVIAGGVPYSGPVTGWARLRRRCRTTMWFLRRPRLYSHLLDLIYRRLFLPKDKELTRDEALSWCAERAQPTAAALERLTGSSDYPPVESLHADVFDYARRKAQEVPGNLGGPGDLHLLYHVAEHLKALRIVETGIGFGWSSLALLLSVRNRPGGMLFSSDRPSHEGDFDAYTGCVVPEDLRARWRVYNQADKQALPKALRDAGTIDMCHYDSDKSYAGRLWAYPRLWQALRPGGIFVSDDIDDNVGFRDFAAQIGCEPIVIKLEDKYVGVLVKPGDAVGPAPNRRQ